MTARRTDKAVMRRLLWRWDATPFGHALVVTRREYAAIRRSSDWEPPEALTHKPPLGALIGKSLEIGDEVGAGAACPGALAEIPTGLRRALGKAADAPASTWKVGETAAVIGFDHSMRSFEIGRQRDIRRLPGRSASAMTRAAGVALAFAERRGARLALAAFCVLAARAALRIRRFGWLALLILLHRVELRRVTGILRLGDRQAAIFDDDPEACFEFPPGGRIQDQYWMGKS